MVPVGFKTLLEEKPRFALGAGGVALAIMLILVLQGIFAGVNRQITAYLDVVAPDLVVAQKDSRNFLGARSTFSAPDLGVISGVDGVTRVVPVIVQYVILDLHGRKEFSLMIGFQGAKGGGPWEMRQGRSATGGNDVVFDAVVARRHGIHVGDKVTILGRDLRVSGLSGGTSSWMTGTFFVNYDTASEMLGVGGNPSFALVSLDPVVSDRRAIADIERQTRLTATPRMEMNANDLALYSRILNGPLELMITVAFLVGVMLVGLTTYTATLERAKEYGALKAIGMGNSRLYALVLLQALTSSAVGFVAGVGLTFAVRWILSKVAPQFLVSVDAKSVAIVAMVAFMMGAVASLIPARAIAAIDPAIAFRRGG